MNGDLQLSQIDQPFLVVGSLDIRKALRLAVVLASGKGLPVLRRQ